MPEDDHQPAVYDTTEEFLAALDSTLTDQCEEHLMHACDSEYGDVWQCDLPPGHADLQGRPTRHHAWAGFTGALSGDGFDADCVELFWHSDREEHPTAAH